MVPLLKYFPLRHRDLSSIARVCIQSPGRVAQACNLTTLGKHSGGRGEGGGGRGEGGRFP